MNINNEGNSITSGYKIALFMVDMPLKSIKKQTNAMMSISFLNLCMVDKFNITSS